MLHAPTHTEGWVEGSDDNGRTWYRLPEYKVDLQPKSATCYIEAKTGQRFRLAVQDKNVATSRTDLVAHFYCDGNRAAGCVLQRHNMSSALVEGINGAANGILPFVFSELRTTSDEGLASDSQKTEEVGRLRVELWRVNVTGKVMPGVRPDNRKTTNEAFLEQRVKKKTNHQVGFGDPVPAPAYTTVATTYKDTTPYLVFHFIYMSDALLDINKIRPWVENAEEAAPVASTSRGTGLREEGRSSSDRSPSISVKREKLASNKRKDKGKNKVINLDDDDDSSELERLRAENARLKKKVKLEKPTSGAVIDLSED